MKKHLFHICLFVCLLVNSDDNELSSELLLQGDGFNDHVYDDDGDGDDDNDDEGDGSAVVAAAITSRWCNCSSGRAAIIRVMRKPHHLHQYHHHHLHDHHHH